MEERIRSIDRAIKRSFQLQSSWHDQILFCSHSSLLFRIEFTFFVVEEIVSYFFAIMQIVAISQFLNYNDVIIT